jgi:hypothetical protein
VRQASAKKAFFFEKKNQKTFDILNKTPTQRATAQQKFFASFFQKRSACLDPSQHRWTRRTRSMFRRARQRSISHTPQSLLHGRTHPVVPRWVKKRRCCHALIEGK